MINRPPHGVRATTDLDHPRFPVPAIAASWDKVQRRNAISARSTVKFITLLTAPADIEVPCRKFGRPSYGPEHAKSVFHIPGFQTQNSLHGDQKSLSYQSELEARIVLPGLAPTSYWDSQTLGAPQAHV